MCENERYKKKKRGKKLRKVNFYRYIQNSWKLVSFTLVDVYESDRTFNCGCAASFLRQRGRMGKVLKVHYNHFVLKNGYNWSL